MSVRGTFVYRGGELVEKGGPLDVRLPVAASHLPRPYVISDQLPDLRGMHDGKFYDSKSKLRRSYRAAGVIELGSDAPTTPAPPQRKRVTRNDVGEAYRKVRDGYRPRIARKDDPL